MRTLAPLLAAVLACNIAPTSPPTGPGGGGSGGGGSGTIDLRVTVSGSGRVVSTPAGIDCGPTCTASFASGTVVGLSATPAAGSRFAGWSGSCTGTAGCQITASGAAVTATFEALPPPPPGSHSLTVTRGGSGSGYVGSAPGGIDCGPTCSGTFADGAVITLSASADPGSTFAGWSGACSGTAACSVTLHGDVSVAAQFQAQPPPPPPPADDCAGLVPGAPSAPAQYVAANQDLVSGSCDLGDGDGTGHVATIWQNHGQPHQTAVTFLDAHAANVGSFGGLNSSLYGQQSGFIATDCGGAMCQTDYVVLDPVGHVVLRSTSANAAHFAQANDPTGGIVMERTVSGASFIDAIDAAGTVRWTRSVPVTTSMPFQLGVDRQGNVLALWMASGTWPTGSWSGQWFDHAGNPGAVFGAGSSAVLKIFTRTDGGLFLQGPGAVWVGQLDALATSVAAPPAWLAARNGTTLHMVRGGAGYAVLPNPASASVCEQKVEIVSRSGKLCGASTFAMGSSACSTNAIAVGYDGTVMQQLSRDLEAPCTAAGHQCNCTYRLWPAYFQ